MAHSHAASISQPRLKVMPLKHLTKTVCCPFVYQNLRKNSQKVSPSRLAIKKMIEGKVNKKVNR